MSSFRDSASTTEAAFVGAASAQSVTLTTLTVHHPRPQTLHHVPLSTGLDLPRGLATDATRFQLRSPHGRPIELQTTPLGFWSDGSIKWLLLDFVADEVPAGSSSWALEVSKAGAAGFVPDSISDPLSIKCGRHGLELRSQQLAADVKFVLKTERGQVLSPVFTEQIQEARGPVRWTLRLEGEFPRCRGLRCVVQLSTFAGTNLMKCDVRLHNPNRAKHAGGLWDLGDAGSIRFESFDVVLQPRSSALDEVHWTVGPNEPEQTQSGGKGVVEIYQDSSGRENWQSRNHSNAEGRVPCRFRGYEVRTERGISNGDCASPALALRNADESFAVVMPEFWQKFPSALQADKTTIIAGLFPAQFDDVFELQGGEQTTKTVWLWSGPTSVAGGCDPRRLMEKPASQRPATDSIVWPGSDAVSPRNRQIEHRGLVSGSTPATPPQLAHLQWLHDPVRVVVAPDWHARTRALPYFINAADDPHSHLRTLLSNAVHGPTSLLARRDVIDEYGWRNFGELWADHEQAYFKGSEPVISHYNNQFDGVFGAILQLARTGDPAWFDLFDPLARHVLDIDLYHTDKDRAAYNGGLFWHTDHYVDAATCTHRTYSAKNAKPGRSYGGGPSDEHNYTTGLLHYYWLTGNSDARQAVLSLADWVINVDDGSQTIFGLVDSGPTGLASATAFADYHGPGRGAGNSVNALLDAWQLTRDRTYLRKAEELIQRVIHPEDDIDALDLLNVEARWSYTVFLSSLAKSLSLKEEAGQRDAAYEYARASLLHYGRWMLHHEEPYFDHPEKLEFPTETWAAQELRKANVLRLAAKYATGSEAEAMQRRGDELADRAWSDLQRFESRFVARSLVLAMTEGTRDCWLRTQRTSSVTKDCACETNEWPGANAVSPRSDIAENRGLACGSTPATRSPASEHSATSFPPKATFIPQRDRVKASLRSPSGLLCCLLHAANPTRWPRFIRALVKQF